MYNIEKHEQFCLSYNSIDICKDNTRHKNIILIH